MKRALGILAFLLACNDNGSGGACDYTSSAPTGDVAKDILGLWDGWGTDSYVVRIFRNDGSLRQVELPNTFAPNGTVIGGTWRVKDGKLEQSLDNFLPEAITVTSDSLIVDGRTHRRVNCDGGDFN